jgi:hypothetical protein
MNNTQPTRMDPEQSSDAVNDNPAYKLLFSGRTTPDGFGFDRMPLPFRSGLPTICHQYGQDLSESPENRYHVRQI